MEHKHTVKTVCKFCRREFDSFGMKKVCNECDANMEKEFKKIKEYINEFPEATVSEICEALNVPSALIKFYLKEERLLIRGNNNNYFLKCVECGKPINSGRYCFECEANAVRSEMKNTLQMNADEAEMNKEIARFHSSSGGGHGRGRRV